ncbi:DUF1841 family protein [Thermodesulfobacteriota bacterium]
MEDQTLKLFRSANREHLHFLWEKAKNNDLDGLGDEDRRLAEAMLIHKDEFFNIFEFADVLHDREFDPDTDVNPFLHIIIHTTVENQLAAKDPIEVFQFYNAMRKKKCSHHDTIHLIGAIFVPLMFDTMKHQTPFDNDRYVALLKKYKSRKPDKIWALLDSSGNV